MLKDDKKIDLNFIVLGNPIGKSRPRFTKSGRVYTPAKSAEYEKRVMQAAWSGMKRLKLEPTPRPVHVELIAYLPIPKSWTKKKKEEAMAGAIKPNKPDLDNILKSVLDGCNEVVYLDDKQVHSIRARKLYQNYERPPCIQVCVSWT